MGRGALGAGCWACWSGVANICSRAHGRVLDEILEVQVPVISTRARRVFSAHGRSQRNGRAKIGRLWLVLAFGVPVAGEVQPVMMGFGLVALAPFFWHLRRSRQVLGRQSASARTNREPRESASLGREVRGLYQLDMYRSRQTASSLCANKSPILIEDTYL